MSNLVTVAVPESRLLEVYDLLGRDPGPPKSAKKRYAQYAGKGRHLNESDREAIRAAHKAGSSLMSLAREYGKHRNTIRRVVMGGK